MCVCVHIQSYYTHQKHLSRAKEKGCWGGLIGPNLPYFRGGPGRGFYYQLSVTRLQREGCFRRKTPELTFRASTRNSPLRRRDPKKRGGGRRRRSRRVKVGRIPCGDARSQVRGRKFERPQRCTSIISSLS